MEAQYTSCTYLTYKSNAMNLASWTYLTQSDSSSSGRANVMTLAKGSHICQFSDSVPYHA